MKRKLQTLIHWFMANWCNKIRVSETKLPNDISDAYPRVHLTHYAFIRRLVLSVFVTATCVFQVNAQTITVTGYINGLKHQYDCGNDGTLGDNPHPRWQFWFGYDGANFTAVSDNGGTTYKPGGRQACPDYNPGNINLPTKSGVMNYVNIDMSSWEEDENYTALCDQNNNAANNGGTFCVNSDDNYFSRKTISDAIYFWNNGPCVDVTYAGAFNTGSFLSTHGRGGSTSLGGANNGNDFTNAGNYGINQLVLNWQFSSEPTITLQPDALSLGGATRNVCTGLPFTLQFSTNIYNGWTLGRWVKWQSAPDVAGTPGTWTDIPGTLNPVANTGTNFSYAPTLVVGTNKWYRAVASSECGPSPTFPTSSPDLTVFTNPVLVIPFNGASTFCTAPSCGIVYVDPIPKSLGYPYGGDDASTTGGPTTPYLTISKAASTGATYIRVAKGTGTDGTIVSIPNNAVIEGGYMRSGSSLQLWEKSSNSLDKTSITFSGTEFVNANSAHVAAFKSDNKSGWTVKDIDVVTANTPTSTYASSGRGMSNYGFLIINGSSNYTLSRVNISVGNAGAGANGATPAAGGGSTGGAGGPGGSGCQRNCNPGVGTSGTVGNGVGSGVNTNGGNTGNPGSGTGCYENKRDGANGSIGANGNTGALGLLGSNYSLSGSYFVPGGQGDSGGPGGGGQGGGGGGGNVAGRNTCNNCGIRSGGTGGTGGRGGSGGTGGFGGGGSFGIWRNSSSSGLILVEGVNIPSIGAVGAAGNGAAGSSGLSGSGGNAGDCNGCLGKSSCGGTGGQGGTGGNGVAGTSAATVVDGTTTATLTATIPFAATVTLDNFSQRNNISGKMCNNSEIDIKNTTGSALTLPLGLLIVYDQTPSSSSYGYSSNPIKVTTDNANTFYNIQAGATVLNKFLYTATDNRSLPAVAITPITKVICKGSSIDLSKTNSFDAGNIQQYEYIVFADGSNANTPIYNSTSSSFTTPVINTTGRYWVRYRERHNCCGWSRPVFDYFDVIDVPNAPTAISIDGPMCYSSPAAAFTISVTGTKAYASHDSWELFDTDPTFGTPTPIQTSTANNPTFTVTPSEITTYYIRGKNSCDVSTALNVTAIVSGGPNTSGVLATSTSSQTCAVSGSIWHYFRNNAGQVIAAINSNGPSLGDVTMTVTIETDADLNGYDSPSHVNGGIGRNGDCLGQPELSMRRWYTITPTIQPAPGTPANIRLFFTAADYANYVSEINTWTTNFAPAYQLCYGATANETDLAVSKNEIADIPISPLPTNDGPDGSYAYQLSIPSFSTFRFHTNGGIGAPLPVELISFTGFNEGARNVLNWTTASERNADRFEVQKSTSGSGDWQYIGFQKAVGNNQGQKDYTFYDNEPLVGNNYYRLKMIDYDGTFTYSNNINIPISEAMVNSFVKIFPNPTSGKVTVQLQSTKEISTELRITNLLGQTISVSSTQLTKGLNQLIIDLNGQPAGTYLISFTDASGVKHIEKLIKN